MFNDPSCVAVDAYGNLYIADRWNNRVRKVTPAGIISTVAGNGTSGFEGDGSQASFARFHDPKDAAIDSSGSLYISDSTNNRIRKITPGGMVSTVAGTGTEGFSGDGGPATLAMLNNPFGLALDSEDNLYIADFYNSRVRKVTPAGIISTVAGNGTAGFGGDGGPAVSANISYPYNIAVDAAGSLYIADAGNNRIRKVDSAGIITTVAGNGTSGFSGDGSQAASAQLKSPEDVAVDGAGNLYIADRGNSRIRKVTPDGVISTLSLASPTGLTVDATGNVYTLDWTVSNLRKVTPAGVWSWILGSPSGIQGFSGDGGLTSAAQVYSPRGITVDAAGNLYIADTWNQRIRKARIPRSTWDTDADGKNDVTVWRPESGVWYVLPTGTPGTYSGTQWGMTGDLPVPGDYDGDGKTDYSVWRPDSGTWYALSSGTPESYSSTQWGQSTDNPVPGDYDGDLITDLAVWRPGSGVWYILLSGTPGSYTSTQWGLPTDVPVPGDYDGDGKVDLAVWRPSSGIWYILSSRYPGSYRSITWGLSTDIPVPGDFDSDSKTDVAVWRPGSGTWYILPSTTPGHHTATQWGLSADTPVIGDFDNDGKADIAVWRQSSGTWYILLSTNPGSYIATQWGRSGDQPISGATLIIGLLSRQIP
jgi:sugar lactone lactonase YvrE